jgi:hypothetical protein
MHECALATGCTAPDRPVLRARRMAPRRARSRADRRVGARSLWRARCGSRGWAGSSGPGPRGCRHCLSSACRRRAWSGAVQGHAFGALGRPALARLMQWAQVHLGGCVGRARGAVPLALRSRGSRRRWDGSLARCLGVGTHGVGRCRSAVASHPPPARPLAVTQLPVAAPGRVAGPSSRGMLSPRKLPAKGAAACGLRVPPLGSGQTPDCELPRQEPALAGGTADELGQRYSQRRKEHPCALCPQPWLP